MYLCYKFHHCSFSQLHTLLLLWSFGEIVCEIHFWSKSQKYFHNPKLNRKKINGGSKIYQSSSKSENSRCDYFHLNLEFIFHHNSFNIFHWFSYFIVHTLFSLIIPISSHMNIHDTIFILQIKVTFTAY